MKQKILTTSLYLLIANFTLAQNKQLEPLPNRVSIEQDSAKKSDIIDSKWVAVGIKKATAIQHDYTRLFDGKPSYRFFLGTEDNTLSGYNNEGSKGRAELAYTYATHDDFKNHPEKVYKNAYAIKGVYFHGKGIAPQASSGTYQFSFYLPSDYPANTQTIFAQWHGMPDRTLIKSPDGKISKITAEEFAKLCEKMTFKKDEGFDLIKTTDKNGKEVYKTSKEPNGWFVEQGGYPPLAFGFSDGYFYIKANSEKNWMTDKSDRCNANVAKTPIMKPVESSTKASTIAYKMPFNEFPKDHWITFTIKVDWSKYGGQAGTILKPGKLDVQMVYKQDDKEIKKHIVDNQQILIGRNDDNGYYFKFGIYRLASSTVPVTYNLAGFSQKIN